MKIKKEHLGAMTYSKTMGKLILVCEKNIEILKKDKSDVIIKAKRPKQDSSIVEPTIDANES
jgi:hypothetical protein|tara:strand:+ start:1791 stop:1976 length:186 start_codon:yes stop_codon:yes gene_type:complete